MTTRLNKFIAHSTGISRREADTAIENGRVKINGATASLGTQVGQNDQIFLDGVKLNIPASYTYLMLNKPTGYVCSRRQQGEHPTIYSLLPPQYHPLKPVGRLDHDSSGLIILTDDGDFAHQMTHPSFHKTKIYHVSLDHDLEPLHRQMIHANGILLDDGISSLKLSRLHDGNEREWEITMHEGRNRQIRRTFAAVGYIVKKLHRLQFGMYTLDNLKSKQYRIINTE